MSEPNQDELNPIKEDITPNGDGESTSNPEIPEKTPAELEQEKNQDIIDGVFEEKALEETPKENLAKPNINDLDALKKQVAEIELLKENNYREVFKEFLSANLGVKLMIRTKEDVALLQEFYKKLPPATELSKDQIQDSFKRAAAAAFPDRIQELAQYMYAQKSRVEEGEAFIQVGGFFQGEGASAPTQQVNTEISPKVQMMLKSRGIDPKNHLASVNKLFDNNQITAEKRYQLLNESP